MKYPVKPQTAKQWWTIAGVTIMYFGFIVFAIPEVLGILDPAPEDTFSEWVWDLPLWGTLFFVVTFAVVALIGAWASIHFVEGYVARRRRETDDD